MKNKTFALVILMITAALGIALFFTEAAEIIAPDGTFLPRAEIIQLNDQ